MKWFRRLFGKKEPTKTDILDPFPPLDKERIRKTTHLIERAEIDGANEHPASTSDEETSTEQTIHKKCEERQREYMQNYDERQQRNVSRLYKIRESWGVDAVQDRLRELGDRVITEGKAAQGPITTSAGDLKSLAGELHHFRHQHRLLDRTPVFQDQWTCWLVVLVAFLVELTFTAFFLKESGGLPTVVALSAAYCFLNCVVPLYIANLWGRWISYQWELFPLRKLTGWLVIIVTLGLGSLLNLLVGHYRSAALDLAAADYEQYDLESLIEITEQVSNISVTAWNNFQASFLGINDVWSWLLAILGYVFFVAGLIEGYLKDDRYPEYGEKTQRYSEQREKYDTKVSELIEELQELRKKGTESIENEKRKLLDSFSRDSELRASIYPFQGQCERACQALSDDYQELINQYRQINVEIRKTPTPPYFQRKPQLSRVMMPTYELPSDDTADRKDPLIKQLSESTNMLQQQFEEWINNIKSAQEIVPLDPLAIRITEEPL